MNRTTILEELKKVLAPYMADKEKLPAITEQTDLIKDLQINSANLVDIIIEAEEKYEIEIDMDAAEKINTVGSCIDIIIEKMNQKA